MATYGGGVVHIFLQGPRNVGKSTVIVKTIELLSLRRPIVSGGFFTWNDGKDEPCIYMRAAESGSGGEIYRIAGWDAEKGRLSSDIQVFEQVGVRILGHSKGADLIIMDELGYLESNATVFRQAVSDLIYGDIPILGVLRLGDVPWHTDIKRNSKVTLIDVNEDNRDTLPQQLAERLMVRK
jgi:nucleoside-triphosphatase